jgi:hypothetical protein
MDGEVANHVVLAVIVLAREASNERCGRADPFGSFTRRRHVDRPAVLEDYANAPALPLCQATGERNELTFVVEFRARSLFDDRGGDS